MSAALALALELLAGAVFFRFGLPGLARRMRQFSVPVAPGDPWHEPIRRMCQDAGIALPSIRIALSDASRPTFNRRGELILPSGLLRRSTPEQVAILAAPALVARPAEAQRLMERSFLDPDEWLRQAGQQGGQP